jgi:hypothetical protein
VKSFSCLISLFVLIHATAYAFDFDRALRNYRAVTSGRAELSQFPPNQRQEIYTAMNMIHRQSCDGPPNCCDAQKKAEDAAVDLESYASDLVSCAANRDFYDDCYSEYSNTEYAYSDYEDAVSEVDSECD